MRRLARTGENPRVGTGRLMTDVPALVRFPTTTVSAAAGPSDRMTGGIRLRGPRSPPSRIVPPSELANGLRFRYCLAHRSGVGVPRPRLYLDGHT